MGEGDVGAAMREAVIVVLKLGGPPLVVALLVGLVVSLLQAVTQIHEQTLAVVPKIAAVICTVVVLGPFMLTTLNDFARLVFDRLVAVGGS
ncbi:MAG: flagellar biosynthesis protein FliQ [Alphaproteobacteria bacterium]|nr:flagellar biosynthesis protein FliQ [Alphaproteobacteria bacterium]